MKLGIRSMSSCHVSWRTRMPEPLGSGSMGVVHRAVDVFLELSQGLVVHQPALLQALGQTSQRILGTNLLQVLVRAIAVRIDHHFFDPAQIQPLGGKIVHQGVGGVPDRVVHHVTHGERGGAIEVEIGRDLDELGGRHRRAQQIGYRLTTEQRLAQVTLDRALQDVAGARRRIPTMIGSLRSWSARNRGRLTIPESPPRAAACAAGPRPDWGLPLRELAHGPRSHPGGDSADRCWPRRPPA